MLAAFLQAHHALLTTLATNWLDSGASQFEIWSGGNRLACWPAPPGSNSPYISAPIWMVGKELGQLRVSGYLSGPASSRLQTDAALIAALLTCENNTGNMAAELIATRDQLLALYNLTRSANTSIHLDHTLEFLVQETIQLTQSDAAFILLSLTGSSVHSIHLPRALIDHTRLSKHIERMMFNRANYWFVPEEVTGPSGARRNLLLMPFKVRGADTAVIGIQTDTEQAALSPLIKLLRTIADYTGVRIENLLMVRESMELAKLHTEMELAKSIQTSLLPKGLPSITGLDIWAVSQPASLVGGDFYDLIERPNRPFTFTIGDISGKGLPAAIPMATARALIHFQTETFPTPPPQTILCSLNDEFYKDFTELGMFATAFVGQYYPASCVLQYANAGHSPVVYSPAHDRSHLLKADDIPLGLFSSATYGDQQLRLNPEDVLVIGTDGLYESHNTAGEPFGIDRLLHQVDALASRSAREIGEGLIAAVDNFRHTNAQYDDQTMIVLKCTSDRS